MSHRLLLNSCSQIVPPGHRREGQDWVRIRAFSEDAESAPASFRTCGADCGSSDRAMSLDEDTAGSWPPKSAARSTGAICRQRRRSPAVLKGGGPCEPECQVRSVRRSALEAESGPNGNRTRVPDVRGRCPRPLDDGTVRSAGGAPSTYDEPGVVPAHVCRVARKP